MIKALDDYFEKTRGEYPFFLVCPFFLRNYYWQKKFCNSLGYFPDLKNPRTFNEKIWYLLKHELPERKTYLADKIKFKEYVINTFGREYVPETYQVASKFDDIEWDKLPERFAVKANHGWDFYILTTHKDSFMQNLGLMKSRMNYWMRMNFYYQGLEPQYKNIKRKLYVEELTCTKVDNEQVKRDISLHCFLGYPLFVETSVVKDKERYKFYHDMDWNIMPFGKQETPLLKTERPMHLNKMYDFARIMSKDFKYVRCDFRETEDRLIIGEMTFSPWAGMVHFELPEYDYILGAKIKI